MSRSLHTSLMSRKGSTAPVLTDPAVPTTMHGMSPAALSASICRRSAGTFMRRLLSVGIQRIESVPSPPMSAAFWIHVCVSAEPYTRSRCPESPTTPRSRTFHGAFAARAARKHTMFAMLPPLNNRPPQSPG